MSTLPPEVPYSDLEIELLDAEPPGFFPQNQDSYYGQVRKILGDELQEVADMLTDFYLNQSAATVNAADMDEWEYLVGLPIQPSKALEARRASVLARLNYGAFTRTGRASIVENFIVPTFGDALSLLPAGIVLDSAGAPLLSGATSLVGTYNIVENVGVATNLVSNGSFETDVAGWAVAANTTIARSTAQSKYGAASALATITTTANGYVSSALSPVTTGQAYSASMWVRRNVGARQAGIQISWYTAGSAFVSQVNGPLTTISNTGFTQLTYEGAIAPATATQAVVLLVFQGGTAAANDSFYLDGVQLETAPPGNLIPNGEFETNTAGWPTGVSSIARSTAQANRGAASALCTCFSNAMAWANYDYVPVLPGQPYSASMWVRRNFGIRQASIQVNWYDASQTYISQVNGPATDISNAAFQQLKYENLLSPSNAAYATVYFIMNGGFQAANDAFYLDTVQFNKGPLVMAGTSSFVDSQRGAFYYEVRILDTVVIDTAGLQRELLRYTPAGITFSIVSTPNP